MREEHMNRHVAKTPEGIRTEEELTLTESTGHPVHEDLCVFSGSHGAMASWRFN